MKKLVLLLMLFSTPVLAVEPITGAFGVKLGEVWDGEATKTREKDGFFRYYFVPESPLDAFDTYYVEVTPVKGLIFRIEAYKRGSCDSQYLAFKQALTKKYGSGEKRTHSHIWTQGNRTIELYCSNQFYLTYTDKFIEASRIDELEPDSADL